MSYTSVSGAASHGLRLTPRIPPHTARPRPTPPPGRPAFFRDYDHTIPTKWATYRGLLRALRRAPPPERETKLAGRRAVAAADPAVARPPPGPSSAIPVMMAGHGDDHAAFTSWAMPIPIPRPSSYARRTAYPYLLDSVRNEWRHNRNSISIPRATAFLQSQLDLLAKFTSLDNPQTAVSFSELDAAARKKAAEYARLVAKGESTKRAKEAIKDRPKWNGQLLPASFFNVPMPRFKPQPHNVSRMIDSRLRRREMRRGIVSSLEANIADMRHEIGFWRNLDVDRPETLGDWASKNKYGTSFEVGHLENMKWLSEQFDRDTKRSETPVSLELSAAAERARQRAYRRAANWRERTKERKRLEKAEREEKERRETVEARAGERV